MYAKPVITICQLRANKGTEARRLQGDVSQMVYN